MHQFYHIVHGRVNPSSLAAPFSFCSHEPCCNITRRPSVRLSSTPVHPLMFVKIQTCLAAGLQLAAPAWAMRPVSNTNRFSMRLAPFPFHSRRHFPNPRGEILHVSSDDSRTHHYHTFLSRLVPSFIRPAVFCAAISASEHDSRLVRTTPARFTSTAA